ncbi:cell wall hydrolase [Sphingomonas sp. R86521]|uniref:cell wall hydrolase n=1 Tax=Sphingomonas sp. R86521 TaxID=3093860 RepID=UPI0036D20ADC
MGRIWAALVAVGLVVAAGMSAHAALRAMDAHEAVTTVADARRGYEADEHFPGAALIYADRPAIAGTAAPAIGVTGTIALPDLPMSAAAADRIVASDVGITTAPPFSMARASAADRARAVQCLTAAIYYEAASEPDPGQQAVAQVILNRVRHPAFPATVCGVVYQGSERTVCQFSFACDGAMARVPSRTAWLRAERVAGAALAGYVFAGVGLATHYHTYAVTPAWNRSLVMTDVVGAHFFHRWKGFWGTASAFSQRYLGGEPVPGPHLPVAPVTPLTLAAVSATVPTLPLVQSDYGRGDTPQVTPPAAAASDNLPPASQVLDRWKDSGKPL